MLQVVGLAKDPLRMTPEELGAYERGGVRDTAVLLASGGAGPAGAMDHEELLSAGRLRTLVLAAQKERVKLETLAEIVAEVTHSTAEAVGVDSSAWCLTEAQGQEVLRRAKARA